MEKYIYPYINGKRMYAAVMGACKYIRECGYFNRAVNYYASKYNVDKEELIGHIRARQSAGQKYKNEKKPARKYHYYIVVEKSESDGGGSHLTSCEIVRATSCDNASSRYNNSDFRRSRDANYGGNYAPWFIHIVVGNKSGYDSKALAEADWKNIQKDVEAEYTW